MASALGSLTESPLKALQGNQTGTIQFYKISALGLSSVPALCKFSCSQTVGGGLSAVLDYFNYVTEHTWGFEAGGEAYSQRDSVDPDTLQASASEVLVNTITPAGLWGDPPIWNDQFGYFYQDPPDPAFTHTSNSGADWDKGPTILGLLAAIDAVDWAALWAGASTAFVFTYDRASISPTESGALPYGPSGKTGLIDVFSGPVTPFLALNGTVGLLVAQSSSDGVNMERTQIQIRNYQGTPIPYFIYEDASGADGVTVLGLPGVGSTVRSNAAISLDNVVVYYRLVSEGEWNADLQIIQLPDASTTVPRSITAPHGERVTGGTSIHMVVGMTFEDFMVETVGASWADFIFG